MAYSVLQLNDMIADLGEDLCRDILSLYSCPRNLDVEIFLTQRSAIDFEKQDIARTYLVFAPYKGKERLAGYFSIANKGIILAPNKVKLSNTLKKRISKFGQYDRQLHRYYISAPLLAQIGKNYTASCDKLITGNELLHLALSKVGQAQALIGGKIVYLECEETPALVAFYERHGFVNFGTRKLDADELALYEKKHLVQMLKYLKK